MILVKQQNTCRNGDMVVALVDDSATENKPPDYSGKGEMAV